MKPRINCLLLCIITGFLCVPALAEQEIRPSTSELTLIDQPNPALAGIEKIHVVILPYPEEPNQNGLVLRELEAKVIDKLNKSGIGIAPGIAGDILNIEDLRLYIGMVQLNESQHFVFHIQTLLARKVVLPTKQQRYIKTDVWKTPPVMHAVPTKDMPAKVTEVVLEQVEAFIHAYLAANPSDKNPSPSGSAHNVTPTAPPQPAKSVTKLPVTEHKYIASRNSKVFHRLNCDWAKRIKPENLVTFDNRQQAIEAGKRPCKLCKP